MFRIADFDGSVRALYCRPKQLANPFSATPCSVGPCVSALSCLARISSHSVRSNAARLLRLSHLPARLRSMVEGAGGNPKHASTQDKRCYGINIPSCQFAVRPCRNTRLTPWLVSWCSCKSSFACTQSLGLRKVCLPYSWFQHGETRIPNLRRSGSEGKAPASGEAPTFRSSPAMALLISSRATKPQP